MFSKIKDHPGLLKDRKSGALVNNNPKINEEYLAKRNEILSRKNAEDQINIIQNEIAQLKTDMFEIKNLLKELINVSS